MPSKLGRRDGTVQVGVDRGEGLASEVQGAQFGDDRCSGSMTVDDLPSGVDDAPIVRRSVHRDCPHVADGHQR